MGMSKIKTSEELDVHLKYVISLLKENNIAYKIGELKIIWIYANPWTPDVDNKLFARISFRFDSNGLPYIGIASDVGIFGGWVKASTDDLSDPKSYHWLIEMIKHMIAINRISIDWAQDHI